MSGVNLDLYDATEELRGVKDRLNFFRHGLSTDGCPGEFSLPDGAFQGFILTLDDIVEKLSLVERSMDEARQKEKNQ